VHYRLGGRSTTKRVVGADGKLSKVVRINKPSDDGRASLTQAVIARWPHDGMSIDLGRLGTATRAWCYTKAPGHETTRTTATTTDDDHTRNAHRKETTHGIAL
jgi:hypothetical protein